MRTPCPLTLFGVYYFPPLPCFVCFPPVFSYNSFSLLYVQYECSCALFRWPAILVFVLAQTFQDPLQYKTTQSFLSYQGALGPLLPGTVAELRFQQHITILHILLHVMCSSGVVARAGFTAHFQICLGLLSQDGLADMQQCMAPSTPYFELLD